MVLVILDVVDVVTHDLLVVEEVVGLNLATRAAAVRFEFEGHLTGNTAEQ